MAGFTAIAAVGKSLERLLSQAFLDRPPVPSKPTAKAALIRTEDLDKNGLVNIIGDTGLTILLYRVDYNKTMRAAWAQRGEDDGRGHLALDLHYLLTPWAGNAEHQHMIIGRAMQVIERVGMLSGPLLYEPVLPATPTYTDEPRASSVDSVQILLEEITTEALMRTFDSLPGDFHLSVPYVARVVRMDTLPEPINPPVIDADFEMRAG
jgi:Pvc16 N-terminal domain